jgi:hypothetical protein
MSDTLRVGELYGNALVQASDWFLVAVCRAYSILSMIDGQDPRAGGDNHRFWVSRCERKGCWR